LLGLALIVPSFISSQDQAFLTEKTIRTGVRPGKAYLKENAPLSIQVPKADKARAVLMAASIWAYDATEESESMQHIIPQSSTDIVTIYVDFSAVLNTRIKFHVYFAGPEFYAYDDEDWYPARYKSSNYVEDNVFYIDIDPKEWKKGTYKLVVIAEQETLGSGAESVIDCVFRII
jgi:hypothetical protein